MNPDPQEYLNGCRDFDKERKARNVAVTVYGRESRALLASVPHCLYDQQVVGKTDARVSCGAIVSLFQRRTGEAYADVEGEKDQYHGFTGGTLVYPRMFDAHGMDIFLPIAGGLPIQWTAELIVGERRDYITNVGMMRLSEGCLHDDSFIGCLHDDFAMPVHIGTMQNFAVRLSYFGKARIPFEGLRFGCRLRGILYREMC